MTCEVCLDVFEQFKTLESVAPWLCECPRLPEQIVKPLIQLQMGWNGYGDYCENGCCDFTDKHVRHTCKRKKSL